MAQWFDFSNNSNKFRQTYVQGFVDISGGGIYLRNDNSINLYSEADGVNPIFSIKSDAMRIHDSSNNAYFDISNDRIIHIRNLNEDVQAKLDDLTDRTQYLTTSSNDGKAIFGSSIEISNNLICFSDLSLGGNLFIENYSTFNGQVDICGNLYANYPNNSIPISAITNLESNLNTKSNIISPDFTGIPTAPTADSGTNTTQIATTEFVTYAISGLSNQSTLDASLNLKADVTYVDTSVSNLVNSAPETLNTLNELAAALGDDANFSTTITNSIATKAPINNPTFTGTVGGITKSMVGLGSVDNTSDTSKPVSTAQQTALDLKANIT